MIRTIFVGVVIGLATLWLWDRYTQKRTVPGESILARVQRLWSSPRPSERSFPINATVATASAPSSGGCSCS